MQPAGTPTVLRFVAPQQYIVIAGLILDGTSVTNDTAHHIRLVDCEVRNAPGQGILLDTSDSELIHLAVHDDGKTDNDHGFYIEGQRNVGGDSTGAEVRNNIVYSNANTFTDIGTGTILVSRQRT